MACSYYIEPLSPQDCAYRNRLEIDSARSSKPAVTLERGASQSIKRINIAQRVELLTLIPFQSRYFLDDMRTS
jgi:hypothetical protein